ncbi:type I glyceraldehyde-3-phosphate dehydrogenase [Candidatus Pacearchaeota archaeon RBG_13_36_9]|nr:MAG: type I glyceraldehyde-3-phosphate dehydrogenase [Candidatus Pacearchaeota archaeon RBG_13_36_9]
MRVAINGLGRIGRPVLKLCLQNRIKVVAVNDLATPEVLAYLLKYDSVYGRYTEKVTYGENYIKVGKRKIRVYSETDPEKLPWGRLGVDAVVESTGKFRTREEAYKHILAGAKKVVISAPSPNPDVTIVPGVNDEDYNKVYEIFSLGSCTTNCLAPVAKVLDKEFGITKGFMTTVHAYTNDQNILDLAHKKLRRTRAAGINIIPTTSGATESVVAVLPQLKGRLDGLALRVPVACGSVVDFVCQLQNPATVKRINNAFERAANKEMKGILQYNQEEIVSSDIIGNPHSSIFDSTLTQVIGGEGHLVKVFSWYDNEFGYSNRMVDFLKKLR